MMAEAEREVARHKEASRACKTVKARLAANEDEAWELDAQKQHLQRQEQTLGERLQRAAQQGMLRQEAAETALSTAEEERSSLQARNSASLAKLNEAEAVGKALQARHAEAENAHQKECANIQQRYDSLLVQMRSYHTDIFTVMGCSSTTAAAC
jgi:hypothetical protein